MAKHSGRLELTWTDKDKALLSTGDGKYDYTFVDPSDYRVSEVRLLHEVSRHDAEVPEGFEPPFEPTTDNLLITGDAMHALDALRVIPEYADKYLGKIKLCYIDPPFNTGQAFDNYEDNIEHSIWLTMLRDRLTQIKPLLSDEGSIWVHLDDVEVHRCRVVLDEVMGADSFVTQIVWHKRTTRDNRAAFSISQDYILVYAPAGPQSWKKYRNLMPDLGAYSNPDNDPNGPWRSIPMSAQAGHATASQVWTVTTPTGVQHEPPKGRAWTYTEAKFKELAAAGRIYWPRNGDGKPRLKKYPSPDDGLVPFTIWSAREVGTTDSAKKEIMALFPDIEAFDTPKPERLLQRIIHIATNPGDIVLDCFAGSGTTAAVAHKMGRRWVTSELSAQNVETFTKPRLLKVISGEDGGGISTVTERVAADDAELPDGVTPSQAQVFTTLVKKFGDELALPVDVAKETAKAVRAQVKAGTSPLDDDERRTLIRLLNKVSKSEDEGLIVDLMPEAVKALRKAAKTRNATTVNWAGGGGFTHLQVGESMFEEVGGRVFLADWATNGALTKAMCAQLGIRHRPDGIFAGESGKVRYVVLDGMVTSSTVDAILDQLADDEIVEVWATQVDVEAAERLQRLRQGSRLRSIPDSVLDSYRRKAAKRSPFKPAQPQSNGEKN
ncbi:site-specific DNA-methyltransferase [Mycolicibacterium smegmatis]|uniref:site-specific DNA-methyltransferase n=1 Tax=Mycolicibacterium smegmatis TaxID=1772 RepID=UPI0020A34483|nr:site-specific DNA-methyltransferase [Mycolicibacterium smegmatis]MCP2628100.1 site-specific DNA-methyltransferase [Mycolicibacterium smegmatis]